MMLDRNNKSLNIANVINNNINDEINKYQFTLDVPTEIETQKDMEDVLKNKHRIATCSLSPTPTPPPPTIAISKRNKQNKEVERNKINEDFIKTSLQMTKDELDTANGFADQKNKKIRHN